MSKKNLRLPEASNIFDLAQIPSWHMPREWVIDWAWIGRIKDDNVIKAVTKIKMDYLAKVAELEGQMRVLDANMRKDLAKVAGI